MRKTIRDIQSQIHCNEIDGAEQIRLNIVYRIIQVLGWDIWNPMEVRCDFEIDGKGLGNTLFLCFRSKPIVTITIDNENKTKDTLQQNNKYLVGRALNMHNMNFAIVVSPEWWLFYPNIPNKCKYPKSLISFNFKINTQVEIHNVLLNILSRYQVCSGKALMIALRKESVFLSSSDLPSCDSKQFETKEVAYENMFGGLFMSIDEEYETEFIEEYRNKFKIISPEQLAYRSSLKRGMYEVLKTLTTREERVIRQRFGIDDGYARTLEEIGNTFGTSKERIRQILERAFIKLRHNSRADYLIGYLSLYNLDE